MLSSRDWAFIGGGLALTVAGIIATFYWSIEAGIVVLFLFGMLLLSLGILQRKHQARLQERVLFLIAAEKKRERQSVELDSVSMKKIIGLLHAQQISLEKLSAVVRTNHEISPEE